MDLATILQQFGFPTAVAVALWIAAYRAVRWAGETILVPIKDRHIEFLDAVQQSLRVQEQTSQQQLDLLKEIRASLTRSEGDHEALMGVIKSQHQETMKTLYDIEDGQREGFEKTQKKMDSFGDRFKEDL